MSLASLPGVGPSKSVTHRLQQSVGQLSTTAMARIEREMSWFADLGAQERAWIGQVVSNGVRSFADWYAANERNSPKVMHDVFGAAPRAFAGQISLARTVAMVRLAVAVVEENLVEVLGPDDAPEAIAAVTRYGREVGFAIAEVYARAAEQRGAWDARLEALVVDSVLRGDTDGAVESRASALGWDPRSRIATIVGSAPTNVANPVDLLRDIAHASGLHALWAIQGHRVVILLGGKKPSPPPAMVEVLGPHPAVLGPVVDTLADVRRSAAAALSGYLACAGWADVPPLVEAEALLPERALSGDADAIEQLVTDIYRPLLDAGSAILETTQTYLDAGGSLEATARALFVHANTVRYRLRRAAEVTALQPMDPRDGYTLRIALTLGRLAASTSLL